MANDNNFQFDEDAVYTAAWNEIQTNKMNATLWSRAFSESEGNENKAKALYIKLRVRAENDLISTKNFKRETGTANQGAISETSNSLNLLEISAHTNNKNPKADNLNERMKLFYQAALGDKNQIYYLMKFEEFDKLTPDLRRSWNWAAFLCGGIWALYRKMYAWFFGFILLSIITNLLEKSGHLLAGFFLYSICWILFTVKADSIYLNSIQSKILKAQDISNTQEAQLKYLKYKGGVNNWVIYVFGLIPLIGIIAAIAIPAFMK